MKKKTVKKTAIEKLPGKGYLKKKPGEKYFIMTSKTEKQHTTNAAAASIQAAIIPATLVLFLSLIFSLSLLTSCSTARERKDSYPDYKGFVNDYTDTLSEEWMSITENLVQEVREKTSCEIAVAVIDSLGDATIEEYAEGLFNEWGVGKKETDNGVLLLVAMDERQLRIEVGYGLEPVITDIKARAIIDDIIVPRFKDKNYESGIYNGVIAIANLIYENSGENLLDYSDSYTAGAASSETKAENGPGYILIIVLIANFLPWFLIALAFGAGALRRYIKIHKCPRCKRIALLITTKTLSYPTYIWSGRAAVNKLCRRCGFTERSTITLPMLLKHAYSGSSSSGSSSSSWSSSSGSSHSSSSFGGGSSGGGGASGRW